MILLCWWLNIVLILRKKEISRFIKNEIFKRENIAEKGVQIYEKNIRNTNVSCFIGLTSAGSEQVVNKTAVDSLIDDPVYAKWSFYEWNLELEFGK